MNNSDAYKNYENLLSVLEEKYTNAEHQIIVGETNLDNLIKQTNKLVEDCEKFSGASIEEMPGLIATAETQLKELMDKVSLIDINGPVTEEKLNNIKSIVDEFMKLSEPESEPE